MHFRLVNYEKLQFNRDEQDIKDKDFWSTKDAKITKITKNISISTEQHLTEQDEL